LVVLILIALLGALPAAAQSGELPARDRTYVTNLIDLSELIGSAHAVRVVCNGTQDQFWRSYMQQLLGLEAPSPGDLRNRMVTAFNSGYQREFAQLPGCTQDARDDEAVFSEEGRRLSEALAAHYFPKRGN